MFDPERIKKALNSKVYTLPSGLSREEKRQFIIGAGKMTRQAGEYKDHLKSGYDFVFRYQDISYEDDQATKAYMNGAGELFIKIKVDNYFGYGENVGNGAKLNHILSTMAYNAVQINKTK